MDSKKPWVAGDLMALCAVRYCIGRMTYVVSDCCEWLCDVWPYLSDRVQKLIIREVEDSFAKDDEARADKHEYLPLGHDCDRAQWEKVRKLWSDEK